MTEGNIVSLKGAGGLRKYNQKEDYFFPVAGKKKS